MIRIYALSLLASLTFLSCQESSKKTTPEATTAAPATGAPAYPSVSIDTLKMLWEKCDYVDFIFYNLNISVSQNEKPAIQSTLGHIAADVPVINNTCRPEGRIFFQAEGKNVLQGDFYLGQGCVYYIWYKDDGKTPFAANSLTQTGVTFFQDLFKQALKQPGGQ